MNADIDALHAEMQDTSLHLAHIAEDMPGILARAFSLWLDNQREALAEERDPDNCFAGRQDCWKALASIREDIDRLAAKNVVKPGYIRRKREEVDAVECELHRLQNEVQRFELEAAGQRDHVRELMDLLDRQLLWCRLFGIPDGLTYLMGRLVYTGGRSFNELQEALDIRLARFAEQGPARPLRREFRGGYFVVPPPHPWLDGDWSQREDAVNSALSCAAMERTLRRLNAQLTPALLAEYQRLAAHQQQPATLTHG